MKQNESAGIYKAVIKNTAIGARVTPELKRQLKAEAKAMGSSLSEYVCYVLEKRAVCHER